MFRIAAVLLTICLAACGMKRPLEMPTGPVPEPLLGNPKPAPAKPVAPATGGASDVSTDTKTSSPSNTQ
jgi:predicted small lipoprotein YifL